MSAHQLPPFNNQNTFEDAICDLFNALESTNTFKRFGRNGHRQKGIDLFSPNPHFAIQCKKKVLTRGAALIKKELLDDIFTDTSVLLKSNLKIKVNRLYFASTFRDHPDIDEYCVELKAELKAPFEIIYWGWDTLESKFLDHKILLQKYWPNFIVPEPSKEERLKRTLSLKAKISGDFRDWLLYSPENRKRNSKMILRAYDGTQYPETNDPDEYGEYSWFGAEIKSLYHHGLEFIIGIERIMVFEDHSWTFARKDASRSAKIITVAKVGQINFSDIVEYDIKGDEYYICPHIYCKFRHTGTPFENVYYWDVNEQWNRYELSQQRPK